MFRKKKGILLFLLLLLILLILYFSIKSRIGSFDVENVADALRSIGPWAFLLGVGLILLQTFFPFMPFILLAGANVLVFGLWGGFIINWFSAVLASVLMFYMARTFGREWAMNKLNNFPKMQRINLYFQQNGFKTVFFLRLFPVIPPVAVNLTAGLSAIEARAYILATVLGKLPAIFVESIIGHDLFHFADNKLRLLLLTVGFGIILLIGIRVVKKKFKLS